MRILSAAALALASYGTLVAGPILQYTFNGTATGTLNGVAFTAQSLTITTIGDAATVIDTAGTYTLPVAGSAAAFTIGGVTSGLFLDATQVFDNNPNAVAGFSDEGALLCCDIVQIYDGSIGSTAYATYNLQSPIAAQSPEALDPSTADWVGLKTTLGNFTVTSYSNVTFTVTAAAVPEPSTFALLAASLAALALIARKRI
jgi:hypothetical protein